MFSGIIEALSPVLEVESGESVVRVTLARPSTFQDLKTGDSVACNGICLTLENFNQNNLQFTLAHETLQLLKLTPRQLKGQLWNLERSLRFGDRVHGHLVSGHVEAQGQVIQSEALGESRLLEIQVPKELMRHIWPKGSIALHGVSLTVNQVKDHQLSVCLIPETLKRTNLRSVQVGDLLHIETDYLAKAYFQGRDHGLS